MAYDAKVLSDSISPEGFRLTSFEVTIPRIVLAEFNTHRMLSRNSASSRAIPVLKNIQAVVHDPFVPEIFAENQKGMQGDNPLDEKRTEDAKKFWESALNDAIWHAYALEHTNLHKGLANRILEPYKWQTIITTATEWNNFFALRTGPDAQYEIRKPAQMMRRAYIFSQPKRVDYGEYHYALVTDEEKTEDQELWKKVDTGRDARVSYLTHMGVRDPEKDVELHDRLLDGGHMSPFEHVARPFTKEEWLVIRNLQGIIIQSELPYDRKVEMIRILEFSGNFRGWRQYRKEIHNEHDFSQVVGMPELTRDAW